MAIRAFAICNDMGVLFLNRQLLVFPRLSDVKRALDQELDGDDSDQFEGAAIESVFIERKKDKK